MRLVSAMCEVKPSLTQTHGPGQVQALLLRHTLPSALPGLAAESPLRRGCEAASGEVEGDERGSWLSQASRVRQWINASFPEQPQDNSPSGCPSQAGACVCTMYVDCCWGWIPSQDPAYESEMTQVFVVLLAQGVLGRGGKIWSLFVFLLSDS